jgi:IclR family acetate operon transcriptional repressor
LHAGASGLAILAHLPHADHVDALDSVRLTRETDQTITDPLLLRSELEKIRVRGYALTRGQRVPGAVGIGAPVLSTGGGVLGAVYISIPEQRFADDREPDLSRALLETTRRLGLDLSHLWANK